MTAFQRRWRYAPPCLQNKVPATYRSGGNLLVIIKDGYDEKEKLVNSIDLFIENIDHNNFLGQRREQVKAELSILLAVLFPEKIFESIRDYLETLDWSRYEQYKLFLSSINQIILE